MSTKIDDPVMTTSTGPHADRSAAAKAPQGQADASAAAVAASIRPNYLVCLETGQRFTLLRRHLRHRLRMTPEQYRAKWGLPPDYPMAAEAYGRSRARCVDRDATDMKYKR